MAEPLAVPGLHDALTPVCAAAGQETGGERGIVARSFRLLQAALCGVLLLGACAGASIAKPLRVAHSTWVGYGPFYIAKEKGFFEAEGLEVKLVLMEDVKTRMPTLAAGRVDAAATTVDTVLNFYSPRRPFRYLFAVDDSNGGDGIVANNDIKAVADLKGKRIAFTEASVSQFYLSVLLKGAGLSLKDVRAYNMTAGDAGAAFVARRVDAAVTWEPWLTRGNRAKHGHVLVDSSSSPGLITDIVTTTAAKLAARGPDFRALYRAWVKAVDWQKANEAEADAIMASGVGGWLRKASVFRSTRSGVAYYDAAMNAAFIGSAARPGAIVKTISNALVLGRQAGLFDHDMDPASLIAFEIVNQ